MMKDHYQPLTAGQIHHILKQYQLGTRERPTVWAPTDDELEQIEKEGEGVFILIHTYLSSYIKVECVLLKLKGSEVKLFR